MGPPFRVVAVHTTMICLWDRRSKLEVRVMSATEGSGVILPADVAEMVESRLRSGAYGSAGDVVRDGLMALQDRDAEIERWLKDEVLVGHADYMGDPSTGMSGEEVLRRIRRRSVMGRDQDT